MNGEGLEEKRKGREGEGDRTRYQGTVGAGERRG